VDQLTSGGFEKIIPMTVGIITFIIIIGVVLSTPSWQSTIVAPTLEHSGEIPNPVAILGTTYIAWIPATGMDANHSANISDHYWVGPVWLGNRNMNNYSSFTDPAHTTHFIEVRIIRNNINYVPYSTTEHETRDYIAFDAGTTDWSWDLNWYSVIQLDEIIAHQVTGENYSVVDLGAYNISALIQTHRTSDTFAVDIQTNAYDLYIVQSPQVNYDDFWSVMWWIITFNSGWMPSAPFFAYFISAIVDVTIALVAVRVAQGFIP
jgi:hypothetical protein